MADRTCKWEHFLKKLKELQFKSYDTNTTKDMSFKNYGHGYVICCANKYVKKKKNTILCNIS